MGDVRPLARRRQPAFGADSTPAYDVAGWTAGTGLEGLDSLTETELLELVRLAS